MGNMNTGKSVELLREVWKDTVVSLGKDGMAVDEVSKKELNTDTETNTNTQINKYNERVMKESLDKIKEALTDEKDLSFLFERTLQQRLVCLTSLGRRWFGTAPEGESAQPALTLGYRLLLGGAQAGSRRSLARPR